MSQPQPYLPPLKLGGPPQLAALHAGDTSASNQDALIKSVGGGSRKKRKSIRKKRKSTRKKRKIMKKTKRRARRIYKGGQSAPTMFLTGSPQHQATQLGIAQAAGTLPGNRNVELVKPTQT